MPNIKQHDESHQDMHHRENREQSGKEHQHLTKEGEPDHRYKENRDDQRQQSDEQDDG